MSGAPPSIRRRIIRTNPPLLFLRGRRIQGNEGDVAIAGHRRLHCRDTYAIIFDDIVNTPRARARLLVRQCLG